MSQVTTTITIQFGDNAAAQGYLSAEVDSRPDGLNGGRSQFQPEDVVWLLVYAGPGVSYAPPQLSDGQLLRGSAVSVPQDEMLSFANSRETKLGKPASSTPTISWFGNSLGQVKLGSDQMSLQAERAGVAAARVKYTAQAQSWGIKAPKTSGGSSNFAITVFILGNSNES